MTFHDIFSGSWMLAIFNTTPYSFLYTKEIFTVHLNFIIFFISFSISQSAPRGLFNEKNSELGGGVGLLQRLFFEVLSSFKVGIALIWGTVPYARPRDGFSALCLRPLHTALQEYRAHTAHR